MQTNEVQTLRPRVDVHESEGAFELLIELPGVAAKDLEVLLEDQLLTVRGTARGLGPNQTDVYERRFRLTEELSSEGIQAELADGLLRLSLPKTVPQHEEPRRIEIRTR